MNSDLEIFALRFVCLCGKIWERIGCPNLAMRVRIRTAHHFAPILKDLDPFVFLREFGVLANPLVHHRHQFGVCHLGDSDVRLRVETHHFALATHRFATK